MFLHLYMHRFHKSLPYLFLLSLIVPQAQAPPAVAVLDFEARGVPVYEVETLTDRLRTELASTRAIRLVDRRLLKKILDEQGLQQSGCTTDECAAEVGQLLGAEFMISGSVGKVGNSYTIDARMVSVTTGASVREKSVSYAGEISGLLTEMEILAWQINGLSIPQRLLVKRGGNVAIEKMTVAVLDFDPRGISLLEAKSLTDRFAAELNNTERVILVDRRSMNEVLTEQGYETAECTSEECAAEVGALLGVKYMINGSIGRIGSTFTIDAKMFYVSTGVAEKTKSKTYSGPVDGLITEIELLAWELMEMDPPKRLTGKNRVLGVGVPQVRGKTAFGALLRSTFVPGWGQLYSDRRKTGWSILGSEVALGILVYTQYSAYNTAFNNYNTSSADYIASEDPTQIAQLRLTSIEYHKEMTSAKDQMNNMIYLIGGIWVGNMIHAVLTGPINTAEIDQKSSIQIVYNDELNQPVLRWSIALD